MLTLFATDLDRTLIFSEKFVSSHIYVKCVETHKGKEISYMLEDTHTQFDSLKQIKDLMIVPVTTRSLAQYKRVQTVQDSKYAVTTNGGIILYKGQEFKPWADQINKILAEYATEYDKVKLQLDEMKEYFTTEVKKVDNIFYYVKIKEQTKNNILEILKETISNELWNYTIQGLKLYVIPKGVTKEDALKFIIDYIGATKLITAGDGKLDKGFLELGDVTIIPDNSEVLGHINRKYTKVPQGLGGTKELLKIVEKEIQK